MLILGLTKTTLLDYPEHVAATVFTGGCNFRCPFCHNGNMVLNPSSMEAISEDEVIAFLTKRKNILNGVCITGGEPTIQADLDDFISRIKELGYRVKLDSNGTHPSTIRRFIENESIDYVAMDIKNSYEKYIFTTGCTQEMLENVKESVSILLENRIDYEFRTTVVKELHDEDDLIKIGEMIKGAPRYYIQSYEESDNVIEKRFSSYTKDELIGMMKKIRGVTPILRGVS